MPIRIFKCEILPGVLNLNAEQCPMYQPSLFVFRSKKRQRSRSRSRDRARKCHRKSSRSETHERSKGKSRHRSRSRSPSRDRKEWEKPAEKGGERWRDKHVDRPPPEEPSIGDIYNGKVTSIMQFGCFVQLEGLRYPMPAEPEQRLTVCRLSPGGFSLVLQSQKTEAVHFIR